MAENGEPAQEPALDFSVKRKLFNFVPSNADNEQQQQQQNEQQQPPKKQKTNEEPVTTTATPQVQPPFRPPSRAAYPHLQPQIRPQIQPQDNRVVVPEHCVIIARGAHYQPQVDPRGSRFEHLSAVQLERLRLEGLLEAEIPAWQAAIHVRHRIDQQARQQAIRVRNAQGHQYHAVQHLARAYRHLALADTEQTRLPAELVWGIAAGTFGADVMRDALARVPN